MGNGERAPIRLSDDLVNEWPEQKLLDYIADKSVAIRVDKEYGREDDAKIDQGLLDQAAAALARKVKPQDQVA